MSETIAIDLDEVLELKANVDATRANLTADFGRAADIPSDPNVDERIRKFSGDWDERRDELSDSLEAVSLALGAIHDSFHETDAQLTDELGGD